jgi:glycosyltransferase involved in cell wall biosynthesis
VTFAVITPTIGTPELAKCIQSLQGQDCTHYIVVDGQDYEEDVDQIVNSCYGSKLCAPVGYNIRFIRLDENVGEGWYGHRAFAAASFLVNEDVLCYLDEDNWVEPNYIEAFKGVLNTGKRWAYTLRKIVNPDGEYVCDDNCESLGQWPVTFDTNRYHIDTGCFAVPREVAVKIGHHWYGQWGADRQFFAALKDEEPSFGCTTQHTLNYRLGGSTSLATREMFLQGNKITTEVYGRDYPWHTQRERKSTIITYKTSP